MARKLSRFARALRAAFRALPGRFWRTLGLAAVLFALFALDRHTGITAVMVWFLWRTVVAVFRGEIRLVACNDDDDVNPATGLPIANSVYDVRVNPATGLSMANNACDVGGNPYGFGPDDYPS